MKIINVGEPVMVVGSTAADKLCEKLWGFKGSFLSSGSEL
jgi:hypothetical protein